MTCAACNRSLGLHSLLSTVRQQSLLVGVGAEPGATGRAGQGREGHREGSKIRAEAQPCACTAAGQSSPTLTSQEPD